MENIRLRRVSGSKLRRNPHLFLERLDFCVWDRAKANHPPYQHTHRSPSNISTMSNKILPGQVFRNLVSNTLKETGKPLQILGTINAYSAMLARHSGCKAVYLSGSGVATASYGLPDLGITTINDVVEDAKRITNVMGAEIPLMVDIDTGFGVKPVLEVNAEHPLVKKLEGSAHFEDLANILFDQALLAEGGLPADPAAYVRRVNALLV